MVTMNKRTLAGWAGVLVLVAGLSAAACNSILGIGTATDDPSLDDAGSGQPDGGDGGGDGNDCTTYCGLLAASCSGNNTEYISNADCQAICANFDPGQTTASTGDTLGCRIHYAQMAAADPLTYCQKAGPVAGGGCNSDPCHAFCVLVADLCDANGIHPYDGGTADCLSSCAGYTYLLSDGDAGLPDGGDAGIGDTALSNGDTLNCRIYHLESAYNPAVMDAYKTHCPHTAAVSAACY